MNEFEQWWEAYLDAHDENGVPRRISLPLREEQKMYEAAKSAWEAAHGRQEILTRVAIRRSNS